MQSPFCCKATCSQTLGIRVGLPRWLSGNEFFTTLANAGGTGAAGLICGWEEPREKDIATHSSILSWEIQWTEEPGGL